MIEAKSERDPYIIQKHFKILTPEQLHIPGVPTFGHHVPPNASEVLKWHYHKNTFEFFFLINGKSQYSTLEDTYTFYGGDILVIYPDEIHGSNAIVNGNYDMFWFQIDISDENNFLFLKPEVAKYMITKLKSLSHRIITPQFNDVFPHIIKAFQMALEGENSQWVATYLQLILHYIIASTDTTSSKLSPDIERAVDYIKGNIDKTITLEELATIANLSCAQFKVKFKKQVGITPRHFINQEKIEYSKQLLVSGYSITDIAMALDFSTSSYYASVFKKYTSYTPKGYIKRTKKE